MNFDSLKHLYETERLTLRPFIADDEMPFGAYHSRPEVYRYLYAAPSDGSALKQKFARALATTFQNDGDVYRLAVVRKTDAALIGEVLLKLESKQARQGEVGYIFNPDFGGKGYATEAVKAIIGVGFNDIGFHRIFARLDSENLRSVRIVERIGFRREAHLVENDCFDGRWGSEYIYAMLKSEWAHS
ncbi:GNAT family N-acetyltransferase [Neorhizobium sp. DAR64861/K0K2]|uniref:GNAT family N-acetyltransferase n=1 Tax=unclassified Neorhizobium TaxID=2629175 RepID=UPI003D2CBD54